MTSPTLDLRMLADPALRADPYPLLRELREVSPLVLADGWLVVAARHAECAAALREPTASSERFRSVLAPPGVKRGGLSFLVLDPPDHTRLRRLVSAAFTPRVVAGLRPRIGEIVDRLLMRVAEQGRTDGVAAREEFERYFSGLIAVRRDRPARDLLSLLIQAESEGDKLTEEELLATCVLLLVAGHETTANLIANAILALLRHPDQLDLLRARPELVDNCVEETLRYDAPVQMTTRAARGVLPVGPVEVPDGGLALLLLAAAGRDPAVFPDPDRFDITRRAGGHLAFAAGSHFCLGAGLARLESAVALDAFARRVRDPRLLEPEVEYKANFNLRGPARLDVGFTAIAPAG